MNAEELNATWAHRCFDLADQVKVANAEIARLKHPDLVTVRRDAILATIAAWAIPDVALMTTKQLRENSHIRKILEAMEAAAK